MRGSGGRTASGGSLRGERKGKRREEKKRLRSGSGGAKPSPASPGPRDAVNRRTNPASATAVAVAYGTSKTHSTPAKKTRKHLEVYLPLQRHLYGEERIFLPCPGSRR